MTGKNGLDYGQLMQRAMRRMMAEVLGRVAEEGLPGEHHFYIGFETSHPGVGMPKWLLERYPQEMTIVLQDWFDNLAVTSDRFTVTLNFSDQPETLVIPFDAVRTFVDPSVKFGLKFDAHDAEDDDNDPGSDKVDTPASDDVDHRRGEVVSLDKFRKP